MEPAMQHIPVTVSVGMHVVIDLVLVNGTERYELDIVPDENADFTRGSWV